MVSCCPKFYPLYWGLYACKLIELSFLTDIVDDISPPDIVRHKTHTSHHTHCHTVACHKDIICPKFSRSLGRHFNCTWDLILMEAKEESESESGTKVLTLVIMSWDPWCPHPLTVPLMMTRGALVMTLCGQGRSNHSQGSSLKTF